MSSRGLSAVSKRDTEAIGDFSFPFESINILRPVLIIPTTVVGAKELV
jgi:hypothetical protein